MSLLLSLFLASFPMWQASQNAVLFSAEAIAETRIAGENVDLQCEAWREWVEKTRIGPGLFERLPGYGDINSHDNYLGMALGGMACDFPDIGIEIANELVKKGWAFNDAKLGKYDIRGQLTPKDIVPIKLVAGWEPSFWETLYASADLCIGKSWNLKRARVLVYEHYELTTINRLILAPCIARAKRMVNYVDAGCGYHGEASTQCVALRQTGGAWK